MKTHKANTLLMLISMICIVVSACNSSPVASPTNLPISIGTDTPRVTNTPESSPTMTPQVLVDSNALQLWSDPDSVVAVKTRFGIGSPNSFAMSPDGKVIAVGTITGIYLYRFDSLKVMKKALSEQPVNIVEWSPRGNYLAAVSGADVIVLDAKTGIQMYALSGHQEEVRSIAWSLDGRMLASLSIDQGAIHAIAWDSQTGKLVSKLEFDNRATNIQWMPDGHNLAIGPMGRMIILWDIRTGKWSPLWQESDLFDYVTNVSWTSDRTKLLAGGELGKVFVWDIPSDQQLLVYNEDWVTAAVDSVAWSPDAAYVAAGFRDGAIIVWDTASGTQLQKLNRKLSGNTDTVLDLDWSPDSRFLISLSRFEPITVWDVQTGEELRSSEEHTSWVLSEAWSPDGTKVATSSEDGVIIIRDALTGKILQSIVDPIGWVSSLAWSPDGKQLASGTARVTIWDVLRGEQIQVLSGHGHGVQDMAWSPDGTMFASGSMDGQLFVWNAFTGERLQTLTDSMGEMYHIVNIVWSSQGDLLGASYAVFPDQNNLIRQVGFWNPKTGEQVRTRTGPETLTWYSSKDIAVSIYNRKNVALWHLSSGEDICHLKNSIPLGNFAWSPDGNLVVASHAEDGIVIFDAKTCAQLHILHGHADAITSVAWSPRGDFVASASWDGTVIIWGVDSP